MFKSVPFGSKSTPAGQPKLRRRCLDNFLTLDDTAEATMVKKVNQKYPNDKIAREPALVKKEANARLPCSLRGTESAILAATSLEFGCYYGQTFKWALENATGWVVAMVADMSLEREINSPLGVNKKLLCQYALSFPEVKTEVEYRHKLESSKHQVKKTGDVGFNLVRFGKYRALTWKQLSTSTIQGHRDTCKYVRTKKDMKRGTTLWMLRAYLDSLPTGTGATISPRSSASETSALSTSSSDPAVKSSGIPRNSAAETSKPSRSSSDPALKSNGPAPQASAVLLEFDDDMSDEAFLQLTQEAEKSTEGLGDEAFLQLTQEVEKSIGRLGVTGATDPPHSSTSDPAVKSYGIGTTDPPRNSAAKTSATSRSSSDRAVKSSGTGTNDPSRNSAAGPSNTSSAVNSSDARHLVQAISRPSTASSGETLQDINSLDNMSDGALLQLTQEAEDCIEGLGENQTGPQPLQPFVLQQSASNKLHLKKDWLQTLPLEDHVWLSKALYDERGRLRTKLSLWYYPPQPAVLCSQPPASGHPYFQHRFFLWMPYRMWGYQFRCSQPGCGGHQLSSCGVYKTVRRVIDQVDDYYMGTEYLQCGKCQTKTPGWSLGLLAQLDLGLREYFPAVLSYKLALDKRVVSDLRDRSLGNSSTRLQRTLQERHYSDYLQRKLKYFTTLDSFGKNLTTQALPKEVPAYRPVPSAGWVLSVYVSDIFSRLGELKAKVTSTFGTILKMDSTKRVVKKLAGSAGGTAAWSTNVGNEHGQVLMSVLTASEATGLKDMAQGLIKRYESAGVPQPLVLYVDRGCCGKFLIWAKDLFPQWKEMAVRLDIWHFMHRLGSCVSSESHPLYSSFMRKLSGTIFQWDEDDVKALRQAKAQELIQSRSQTVGPRDVELTSKELTRHCRRGTRGAAVTEALIDQLLTVYKGDVGLETLGVPFFDIAKLEETWAQQRKHIPCIQDLPGVSLYQQVGTQVKGNMTLPIYRCARGSTSLESFHLHLNRFIPGESASAANFQAYLLEGMARWNADRHAAAMKTPQHWCHNYELQREVERLASKLGADPGMTVMHPARYTGELIGVEYLYSQTGEPLSNLCSPEEGEGEQAEQQEDVTVDDEEDDFIPSPPTSPQPSRPIPVLSSSPPHLYPDMETRNAEEVEQQEHFREPSPPVLDNEAPVTPPDPDSPPADEHGGSIRVIDLARHLVTFQSVDALSTSQVAETIHLFNSLADADKASVKPLPCPKATLTKAQSDHKKSSVVEGIKSVKWGFLGQAGTAAQQPDVSRLVEELFTLMLEIHPAGGRHKDRLANILVEYGNICRLITQHRELQTIIWLVDVNKHTLSEWLNRTERHCQVTKLEARVHAPAPPMTVRDLPPPVDLPLHTPSGESLAHTITTEETPGQSKSTPLLPEMEAALKRTRKRQRVREEERVLKRMKPFNVCKQCGKPKIIETGHRGFKGYSHCPDSADTFEEFLKKVTIFIEQKKTKNS